MRAGFLAMAAMAMPLALAGCEAPPAVYVDGGYVRLNPNPQAPSAAYFKIHAGNEPIVLRGVMTEQAVRLEIHESVTQDGMASMRRIENMEIPARSTVSLAPGGKHIMLWSINPTALEAGKMSFTFIFSNGDRVIADAVIQKAGDDAGSDHSSH